MVEVVLLTVLCVLTVVQIILSVLTLQFGLKLANHLKDDSANMDLLRGSIERVVDRRGLVEIAQNWTEQEWS